MEYPENLITRCFGSQGSVLKIGGRSITELADRYGTPLFVYDRGAIDQKLAALRTLVPEFEIYYSVKANPNLAILRHFVLRGCGLEVASGGEFMQALAAGCRPASIFMAGAGKTDRDLELALVGNVGEIHIESPREAARIAAICAHGGVRARVGIRVNPTGEAQGGAMRMGGKPAPFGVDEEKLDLLIQVIESQPCFDSAAFTCSWGRRSWIARYSLINIGRRSRLRVPSLQESAGRFRRSILAAVWGFHTSRATVSSTSAICPKQLQV